MLSHLMVSARGSGGATVLAPGSPLAEPGPGPACAVRRWAGTCRTGWVGVFEGGWVGQAVWVSGRDLGGSALL